MTVIPQKFFKIQASKVVQEKPLAEVPNPSKQTKKSDARKRCNRCKRYGHINSNCIFNPKNSHLIPPPTEEFLQSLQSLSIEDELNPESIFEADTADEDWLTLHSSISDITLV